MFVRRFVYYCLIQLFGIIGYDLSLLPKRFKVGIDLYYSIYGEDAVKERRFYNIGAGGFHHPAWTNVDHRSEYYEEAHGGIVDIDWNLLPLTSIPVESNMAEIVYCSHVIEHVTNEAVQNMFNEVYRILKTGGYFRVTTPNINLDIRAYLENDRHYFYWVESYSTLRSMQILKYAKPMTEVSIQQIFLHHFATATSVIPIIGCENRMSDDELDRVFCELNYEEALDYCINKIPSEMNAKSPGGHMNWFNKDKLFLMLKTAGFERVYLSGYGQSFSPILRNTYYFDTSDYPTSLHVEAIK